MDANTSYNLEKLNSVNDLGVIFDSNLTYKDHMAKKIKHTVYWALLKEILFTYSTQLNEQLWTQV